ncbi:hypothetical protein cyc_08061 [Cyclospora cayetanensis]|uniref:Uncharacterized protein n=1 Tax=Cyclospora cayetanensis TaxID=88456 RepID=A0A1D3CV67_9EIME|nr:hypothetical protein cyc_08061 [Cyclospora cayetanensis]
MRGLDPKGPGQSTRQVPVIQAASPLRRLSLAPLEEFELPAHRSRVATPAPPPGPYVHSAKEGSAASEERENQN